MSVPLLDDSFWSETASATLHPQTVLGRIRTELSEGRSAPITVAETFNIAQTEMGVHPNLCIFAEGEVARPLWIIGAVWGFKKYGMAVSRARSFGCFIGSFAGGDAIGPGPADALELQARAILQRHLGPKDELNWAETTRVLEEVIAFYKGS